uniref:Uncharacterized protein n=1 Tax=Meloidogyne hapla TaxID=6305 RepID=A0A1I8BF80_MELHA
MAKFKEERELNLEELFTIKKDKEELIKTNEKLLEENTQISFKLKEVTSDNNKFKEDFDSKLEELTKTKEENQELKNELECAKNKLSQLQSEELEKENKFKEEMEKVLIERKQATDQADILKIDHKRIYDLYTTQQAEFKDLNVQNGNLASENKKLKLDFEHLQERSQNV